MNVTIWTILAAALATYLTRVGGHLVLSRFQKLDPRVEAALDAVPAAVMTASVVSGMPILLSTVSRPLKAMPMSRLSVFSRTGVRALRLWSRSSGGTFPAMLVNALSEPAKKRLSSRRRESVPACSTRIVVAPASSCHPATPR